jgi:hypothetical protein
MSQNQIAIVLLLLILPILLYLYIRVRAGNAGKLRPMPALEQLPAAVGRSAETGQPLHVSVGVAGVGGTTTAETWAGLTVLSRLADEAAASDTPLMVTVADPTVLPLAQDVVRRAFIRHGNPEGYDPTQVRFIAPEPVAYAAGVMGLLDREQLTGNVMIGTFGTEYLLMGETGARRGVRQVVGTSDPNTLSLMYASADETLIGEEIFAGGAYTMGLPAQVASLLAEDWARWLIILVIIVAAIVKIL